jgi:ribosome biogenesis GTPase
MVGRLRVPMHAEKDMHPLSVLGFSPFFEEHLQLHPGARPARVASEHRGLHALWSEHGVESAQLAGRLRHELDTEQHPGVGDWVTLRTHPGSGPQLIDAVLPRRTLFTRGANASRAQVIAANVDLVFVVAGLDADYNLRRIERYVSRVWASGARPLVLLNKADLASEVDARVRAVELRCPTVTVLPLSALRAEGLDPLRAMITEGLTAALVGSSGAGKSTLINSLLDEERMATGGLRERDGRGRHTTTHRQLVRLPGGGLLLDTPGMRELRMPDEEGLNAVFSDIASLARRCRFRDCQHDAEPGCAVREAIEAGLLAEDRLLHLQKLEREAHALERRHDERLRRQEERKWIKLTAGARLQSRRKREFGG